MANRFGEDVMPVGLGAGTEGYLLGIKPRIGDDDTGSGFLWVEVSQYKALRVLWKTVPPLPIPTTVKPSLPLCVMYCFWRIEP